MFSLVFYTLLLSTKLELYRRRCNDTFRVSLSTAVLVGKISKRCEIRALVGSLRNIVNHLLTGTTDDVL